MQRPESTPSAPTVTAVVCTCEVPTASVFGDTAPRPRGWPQSAVSRLYHRRARTDRTGQRHPEDLPRDDRRPRLRDAPRPLPAQTAANSATWLPPSSRATSCSFRRRPHRPSGRT